MRTVVASLRQQAAVSIGRAHPFDGAWGERTCADGAPESPGPGAAGLAHILLSVDTMPDTSPIRILVADDQVAVLDALRLLLSDAGYDVTAARSPGEALERLEATDFDLAILDLNYTRDTTSGQEGFDLMERIRALDPTRPVLVVRAWSSVAGAVEAMRRGARDYIEKPWDDERLLATVRFDEWARAAMLGTGGRATSASWDMQSSGRS